MRRGREEEEEGVGGKEGERRGEEAGVGGKEGEGRGGRRSTHGILLTPALIRRDFLRQKLRQHQSAYGCVLCCCYRCSRSRLSCGREVRGSAGEELGDGGTEEGQRRGEGEIVEEEKKEGKVCIACKANN